MEVSFMQTRSIRVVVSLFALLLLVPFLFGGSAFADEKMEGGISCKYCGMMKSKFGYSWMIIQYDDGTTSELCSVHGAAIDLALNIDKFPEVITVGDYNTKAPIDAEKAFWVIGGDKMGVMTARAKWAFQTKDAADAFIKEHGGKQVTFDDAIKAAYEDMYADTNMIRKKRQMKRMKKNM